MSGFPVAIASSGLVTGVGLNAAASCAAIRCAIDNFRETRFMDKGGEWILGSEVPFEESWRGESRLIRMAASAIRECLEGEERVDPSATPLMLCLSEHDRPGRVIGDDHRFFEKLQKELDLVFHQDSRVIARGNVAVAVGLNHASHLLQDADIPGVLIAATDSFLSAPALAHYEAKDRLLTSVNSNGFIPGEASAALLVEPAQARPGRRLLCTGLGFAVEEAHVDSELPLRADGLSSAIRQALEVAGTDLGAFDFRITDVAGEQYDFREASLALLKTLRKRKEEFDLWHPADCVGQVGAAAGVVMLAVLKAACEKGWSKGDNILAHMGNDDGKRCAMTLSWGEAGGRHGQ